MDTILKKMNAFRIVGLSMKVDSKNPNHQEAISEFWHYVTHDEAFKNYVDSTPEKETLFGTCHDFNERDLTYMYTIGVKSDVTGILEGESVVDIPAIDYAIFDKKGPIPQSVRSLWNFILEDWFPNSKFEHTGDPDVEVYPDGNILNDDYICHIWVPVKEK